MKPQGWPFERERALALGSTGGPKPWECVERQVFESTVCVPVPRQLLSAERSETCDRQRSVVTHRSLSEALWRAADPNAWPRLFVLSKLSL
ncbi:hypothetical protein SKAU_G00171170 [Synaphobranchus kaupii]|uniref:Uncharacterized protein n=1 Tax=Synaphobranchus kaupii TaxID=118154 RepID=A0A9Q1FKE5_SYNKA|nr:hypothetical protein SKAU_G00171170 [Synaphobranchus kaupii]